MNRYLNDVKAEHTFVLYGGHHIKNLYELKTALATMPLEAFHHHVHNGKNDFSTWVEHCIHDKSLAEKIGATTSKEHMIKVTAERITELVRQSTPGAHLARGPFKDPLATDHIVREIEMLSKGFSTDNVIQAVKTQNMVTNVGGRTMHEESTLKESEAGIFVLRRAGDHTTSITNTPQPLPNLPVIKDAQMEFYEKINMLMHSINNKDQDRSRELYTELRDAYEQTSFSPEDKKAAYNMLKSAYHVIVHL